MTATDGRAAEAFPRLLFEAMKRLDPAIADIEPYEFRYALDSRFPGRRDWSSVRLDPIQDIERRIGSRAFYLAIRHKPRVGGEIVLDEGILGLTEMLFAGLVTGAYPEDWVRSRFSFDVRGFLFLARTVYWTDEAKAHLGGKPWKRFAPGQRDLLRLPEIGYREFSAANAEVDRAFIEVTMKLVAARGTPLLLTLAGPTAAGKTEIVDRLRDAFAKVGRRIATVEMDNFLLDMDYRDDRGIATLGREAYHFDLFLRSLRALARGERVTIPRYDSSISSHDSRGELKPGARPIEVEPADVVFLEGNFPFQSEDVADLVGVRIVYLTDDAIRLKRKWRRDIDYRKKYHPEYLCNRFFRTQFLRAEDCYRSLLAACDMAVDTTDAALWVTPLIAGLR